MTAFTRTWNAAYEAKPADSNNLSEGALRIREIRTDVKERLQVDHEFGTESSSTSEAGYHNKVTLREQAAAPTIPANTIGLYAKLVGAISELFMLNESSVEKQLTQTGTWKFFSDVNSYTAAQVAAEYNLGTTGGTITPDCSLGQNFKITLNANTIFNAPTNAADGCVIVLRVTQDGAVARTVTFQAANFKKPVGLDLTASIGAGKCDLYTLYRYGSNTWIVTGIQRDVLTAV